MTPGAEGAAATYAARSEEEMQRLTALVRSAVGFNQERGDIVEVVNTQFASIAYGGEAAAAPGMFDFLGNLDVMRIIEIVAALIAALAFVFFVLRPLVGGLIRGGANAARRRRSSACWSKRRRRRRDGGAALRPMAQPIDDGIDIAQINGRVRASSVKKVAEVVEQHPDESVQIIRGWLNNALAMNALTRPSPTTAPNPGRLTVDLSRYSGAEKAAIILMALGEDAKKLWAGDGRGGDQGSLASDGLAWHGPFRCRRSAGARIHPAALRRRLDHGLGRTDAAHADADPAEGKSRLA